jgi:hypothetical protein
MALLLLLKLVASLLLLLLPGPASADCEPAACGTLTLRYPFWLGSGNQTSSPCGHPAFEVWCSDGRGVAALKGSSIHVLAIDYANSSFLASHSRVAAGDDGVCRTDFNMSVSIALSPFTISPRNRALCFLSKCVGTAPSGDEFVNATSNCSAPIYAYLGGTYYWDSPPAIATGRCTYSYIPVLGREAAAMTAANYSRLLKDGFVLEWEAGGVGDCRACNASGGQCRYDNAAAAFRCLCPDGRRAAGPKCAGESDTPIPPPTLLLTRTCPRAAAVSVCGRRRAGRLGRHVLLFSRETFLAHCIMPIAARWRRVGAAQWIGSYPWRFGW